MNVEKEYDKLLKSADNLSAKLTDENIEDINKVMEENADNSPDIKLVQSLPSNNGEADNVSNEEGYVKKANIVIDPNTGENKIIGTVDEEDDSVDNTTFEDLVDMVDSGEINVETDKSPVTEEELKNNIGILDDTGNINISDEDIHRLLEVINRRMKGEDFNVYKSLPEEIQKQIMSTMGFGGNSGPLMLNNNQKAIRNSLAEQIIDEFILTNSINRAKMDFNKEVEQIFKDSAREIAESSVGYTKERNQAYREYIETLEDEEKKKKLTETLDTIDSAYNLDTLKEFAKTCKIKKYDIEQPKNYFRDFITKYQNSNYNIYDIKLTIPILERKIVDNEKYNNNDIIAFLVCFCKYIRNYKAENILEHSFMYYVIYNIVIADANVSDETKEVSEIFINNIKEVIDNIKERNEFLK